MQPGFLRIAVILGLLSAIGPFAIDMYLPALPSIGADLSASPFAVQMSLLVFFISTGVAQIVVGPLSDMYGRKALLYAGLVIFAIGSIGSALAPTIDSLIAFRFLQGLGASAGVVVPRAVVRDLHTGPEAARLMSLLMLVFSISPILAPLTGSFIIDAGGWRWVFWTVLIASVLAAFLLTTLEETRSVAERANSSASSALRGYGRLTKDWNFIGLSMIGGFSISSFFIYLANSPFVLIDHFGLSPSVYSLFFSINAVSFFAVSQLTGYMTTRFGLQRVVRVSIFGFSLAMFALFGLTVAGLGSLAIMSVLLFIGYGFLGLVIPTTSVLAMEEHGEIAGTASALMGTLHMATGAAAMVVTGYLSNGTPLPMVAGIAVAAALALLLTISVLGRSRRSDEAESPVAAE